MASLFTEGWIGEHGNNAVPAGLRVYFGQHDKSLIDRHRQDDPTVVILVLVWIGYTAWPLYDLLVLVHAMETRDVGTVTRHVYFDAVHVSLTQQVVSRPHSADQNQHQSVRAKYGRRYLGDRPCCSGAGV